MPKEAIRRGAVDRVLPLSGLAAHVTAWSAATR
jgi:chemotaxis response regulator CheB